MKITGNMILDRMEAMKRRIKKHEATYAAQLTYFASTLKEGEEPKDPRTALGLWSALENKLIRLQELQTRYNLDTMVKLNGSEMSLELAIKYSGVVARTAAKWGQASSETSSYGRGYGSVRAREHEYPVQAIPLEEAQEQVEHLENMALLVKQAIRAGNAQTQSYTGVEDLFDEKI